MADVAVPAINKNAGGQKKETTTRTTKVGDEAILSASDKATMNKLTEQWNAATAAGNTALADSIHEQAEAIRAGYGYSGGADGSGIYAVKTPQQQVMQQQVQQNGAADMQKYLEEMYAAQADAAMKQLEDAYNKNMTALDVAEGKIPQAYEAARNRTAGESAVANANFNEYAAAQGLGSGSGTQAQLARSNALTGSLSSINAQEANALADIEAERAELMRSYQSAITQAQSQNKAALADALYNEMLRLQQEYQNFTLQQQQWQYQLEQDAYQRQLNEAKLAAQYGDTSKLAGMGILTPVQSTPYTPPSPEPEATPTGTPTGAGGYDPIANTDFYKQTQIRSIQIMVENDQLDPDVAQGLINSILAQ